MGCFAGEFIPKGTIFCRADPHDVNEQVEQSLPSVDSRFINDLLYNGDAEKYSNVPESETVTNIGYISIGDRFLGITHVYCEALNDIKSGEELSRYYGPDYWYYHAKRANS